MQHTLTSFVQFSFLRSDMSSSLSPPSLSSPFIHGSSTYRHGTKLFHLPHSTSTRKPRSFRSFSSKCSLDNVPKQFREENLKDGMMDNYKNVPKFLYGLTPSQMDMFIDPGNPVNKMSERVTKESISSAYSYLSNSSISSMDKRGSSKYSMSAGSAVYRGGRRGGRPRRAPPDLPSVLLDARIVFLGMPLKPEVTELIVAEFMWLDYDDPSKPIYLYINSPGTQDQKRNIVGAETNAYAIADMMFRVKADVYTVNLSMAYGQAAMLLSLGKKGKRAILPNASTKLYLPKCDRSVGSVGDMWVKAKELETTSKYYIDLLSHGIGKPREEIAKEIQKTRFFLAQEAVDFGIADKVMDFGETAFEKRDYNALRAERLLKRGSGNLQPAAAGF